MSRSQQVVAEARAIGMQRRAAEFHGLAYHTLLQGQLNHTVRLQGYAADCYKRARDMMLLTLISHAK